jgi:hypothetical protein
MRIVVIYRDKITVKSIIVIIIIIIIIIIKNLYSANFNF